jgi:hypothetical protein
MDGCLQASVCLRVCSIDLKMTRDMIYSSRYEQSRVYQYLKQSDVAHTSLIERKDALLAMQRTVKQDYWTRHRQCCNETNLYLAIVSMATQFLSRREQLKAVEHMKEQLVLLQAKHKQLIDSKLDKMKAWESLYTQPVKRDLMDFCLQTNIEQALTLSFHQIQHDLWSQPMTPIGTTIPTPVNEQVELVSQEHPLTKSSIA